MGKNFGQGRWFWQVELIQGAVLLGAVTEKSMKDKKLNKAFFKSGIEQTAKWMHDRGFAYEK